MFKAVHFAGYVGVLTGISPVSDMAPRLLHFFMLDSTENEISAALKKYNATKIGISCF